MLFLFITQHVMTELRTAVTPRVVTNVISTEIVITIVVPHVHEDRSHCGTINDID